MATDGTTTQAIHIIGFETIRNLALSLLLATQMGEKDIAPECRDVSAQALLSGMVAQMLMEEIRPEDAELAFVAAALRSYGDLLMATFMVEDFRRALQHARSKDSDKAFQQIFGLTPLDLGHEVLKGSGLSKPLLIHLRNSPPRPGGKGKKSATEELTHTVQWAVEFCNLLGKPFLSASEFLSQVTGNLQTDTPNRTPKQINRLVVKLQDRVTRFNQAHGMRLIACRLMDNLECLAQGKEPRHLKPSDLVHPHRVKAVFSEGISKLQDMRAGRQNNRKRFLECAARTIQTGLALDEWIVFIQDGPNSIEFNRHLIQQMRRLRSHLNSMR